VVVCLCGERHGQEEQGGERQPGGVVCGHARGTPPRTGR
jgi:hypothetical protein